MLKKVLEWGGGYMGERRWGGGKAARTLKQQFLPAQT